VDYTFKMAMIGVSILMNACAGDEACTAGSNECSPPATAVGVAIAFNSSDPSRLGPCTVNVVPPKVGNPKQDRRAFDGDPTLRASCRVASSSGGFAFEADVQSRPPETTMQFQLDHGFVDASGEGQVSLAFYTAFTSSTSLLRTPADLPCSVSVILRDDKLAVEDGAIWASFKCPALTGDPLVNCWDISGEFTFENCAR